jgi:OOP family OmpA-OmpF porin
VPEPRKEEPTIDDVFLLYHDGILIKHETRRLKPDIDTDILSGMLTAVQSFVKDSFRSEEGHLDRMTFGEMHILIGRGQYLILAAMMGGEGADLMAPQMQKCIEEMEVHHAQVIEGWDGNMTLAKTLTPYIKKLIRGEYA